MNQQDRHSAIADFQLIVVQEVLGRLPVTDVDFPQTDDVCADCAECARALARTAFRWDSQKD